MLLTQRQRAMAVRSFARRYGFSSSTVRGMTILFRRAIQEWIAKHGK